jgi:TRAP-type C4-dicarboxylate transport system substrate-binding protein
MKVIKQLILILIIVSVLTLPAYSLTIKIGSIAPARSPWDKALRELGREWAKITGGKVKLKIYPGGIAGNQDDVIRKMRMGILGGALMVNRGFTKLYRDVYALNIPFLITSEDELNYVLDKLKPFYEKAIEKKGFKVVILTRAGFFHFFTKDPVRYPKDMKKHKLSFTSNEPQMEQAWKKSGYHVVPNDLNDLMMALQSGMVTAFYLPPLLAGSGQYFPLAPHMCSQPIAPMVGGIVLTKRTWEKIPGKYKKEIMHACVGLAERLYKKTAELEKEAVEEMIKHGLKIIDFPPGAIEKWREASDKGMNELIGKVFSKEVYDLLLHHLEEFRKKNDNQ